MREPWFLSPWQARSNATILLEHAVSMFMLGPLRLKNQLIRLARRERAPPVVACFGSISASLKVINLKSSANAPV